MSSLDDSWRRADDAFDRALDLSAAERARFLAELSASDPELHTDVQRLLRAHDRSEHFLDEAAPVFGAALLPDLPPSMPDLPAGTRVGSYVILARIGFGGMGVVYKAHDERLERFVALKFLTADLDADEEARSRFLTEARIASALDHPGVAVVHEIAETADHHVFVAMAFYEGATLKDRLLDGPLPLDNCVDVAIQPLCRECDALSALATAYLGMDSLAAAERVVREWIRRQPGSALAWRSLVGVAVAQQRYDDATVANRRAIEISPGHPGDAMYPAESRIRQADFEVADRLLQDLAQHGTTVVRAHAARFQTISFRYQGRLNKALEAAERYASAMPTDPGARLHRAQVLFEMGREAEAAALFDSSASLARSSGPGGMAARQEAWSLTHRATALAALGDTSLLAILADTIESVGGRSYYGRDLFLHHHVRGLLLAARGDLEAAAGEFRRAVYYLTNGYTRTNVELARVLIELERPLEAVPILRPALRGPLEASNLYATHTEIHELLGRAWHAAGRADSARVHDEWVLKAWKDADAGFHERRDAVRRRAGAGAASRTGS